MPRGHSRKKIFSRARCGKIEKPRAPRVLQTTFEHREGCLKEGEIHAHRPGRVHDSLGDQRHSVTREKTAVDHVPAGLVRELADHAPAAVAARALLADVVTHKQVLYRPRSSRANAQASRSASNA